MGIYTNRVQRNCTVTNLPKNLTPAERTDDDAKYDIKEHRYILTSSYVKRKRNVDIDELEGAEEAKVFLDEISQKLYEYIYGNMYETNERIIEYRLANEVKFRNGIINAMLGMVMYAFRSGGDEIGDNHGQNIQDSQNIDFNGLRGRIEISANTERILMRGSARIIDMSLLINYCVSNEDYRSDY